MITENSLCARRYSETLRYLRASKISYARGFVRAHKRTFERRKYVAPCFTCTDAERELERIRVASFYPDDSR